MTETSLTINFASDPSATSKACPYWCRLVEDGTDEKLTKSAAAKMVDDLYQRNPCVSADQQVPVPEVTSADIGATGSTIDKDLCAQLKSGDYTIKVRVVKSHPDLVHTAIITKGDIESTVPTVATVTYSLDVETAEEADLLYPVTIAAGATDQGIEFTWMGVSGPEIIWDGCVTISWVGPMTGRIAITQPTKYDLLTIKVPGIPNYEGSEYGEPQEFDLTVFYNHQTYTERFSSPNDYDSIGDVCGWSTGVFAEDPDPTPLPEDPPPPEDPCILTTLDVYQTSYRPGTQLFDDNKCCGGLPKMSPDCMELNVGTVASKEMTPEAKAYWEGLSQYCYMGLCTPISAVQFVAVGPAPDAEDGCGRIINKTVVQQRNCCDGVEPMELLLAPSVMADNSTAFLQVVGGSGQYQFRVLSSGLYFKTAGGYHVQVGDSSSGYIALYSDNICGTVTVQVVDTCGNSISIPIRATNGRWVETNGISGCISGSVSEDTPGYRVFIGGRYKQAQGYFMPGIRSTTIFGPYPAYPGTNTAPYGSATCPVDGCPGPNPQELLHIPACIPGVALCGLKFCRVTPQWNPTDNIGAAWTLQCTYDYECVHTNTYYEWVC